MRRSRNQLTRRVSEGKRLGDCSRDEDQLRTSLAFNAQRRFPSLTRRVSAHCGFAAIGPLTFRAQVKTSCTTLPCTSVRR